MDKPQFYGIALGVEIYTAIRALTQSGKPATNRAIRDHILKNYDVKLVGLPKENFTRRITSFTGQFTELGYLRRVKKINKKHQNYYYEYRINS